MRKIYDKDQIHTATDQCIYKDILASLDLPFFLIEYEAGEQVFSPLTQTVYFQIVISGALSIYSIRADGSTYSLSSGGPGYMIGEMELFIQNTNNIFVDASEPLLTIAIDLMAHQSALLSHIGFMQLIAAKMAEKIDAITHMEAIPSSLSDRVLNYIRYTCEEQTLWGIEKAAFRLHCSSRQLQRILNKFQHDGIVEKLGKGCYRLLPTQ